MELFGNFDSMLTEICLETGIIRVLLLIYQT